MNQFTIIRPILWGCGTLDSLSLIWVPASLLASQCWKHCGLQASLVQCFWSLLVLTPVCCSSVQALPQDGGMWSWMPTILLLMYSFPKKGWKLRFSSVTQFMYTPWNIHWSQLLGLAITPVPSSSKLAIVESFVVIFSNWQLATN